jgi:hypothetical protein
MLSGWEADGCDRILIPGCVRFRTDASYKRNKKSDGSLSRCFGATRLAGLGREHLFARDVSGHSRASHFALMPNDRCRWSSGPLRSSPANARQFCRLWTLPSKLNDSNQP